MFRTILVPVDGSPFSEQALPLAVAVARAAGASLTVAQVHVPVEVLPFAGAMPVDAERERATRAHELEYVEALAQRAADDDVTARGVLLDGVVVEALERFAEDRGVDLVVMTTHGRGGLHRAWLGSVADRLTRESHRPMLLVRPVDSSPATRPDVEIRRILVTLDGSALAEQILPRAVALVRAADAELVLLRVVTPLVFLGRPAVGYAAELQEADRERLEALAREYLDGVAARLRAEEVHVSTVVRYHVQPAIQILEEADTRDADVVAMATHGRGGLVRLLLGSVADKVLRGTIRPLLLLRPAEE